jgi:hypothetical protein
MDPSDSDFRHDFFTKENLTAAGRKYFNDLIPVRTVHKTEQTLQPGDVGRTAFGRDSKPLSSVRAHALISQNHPTLFPAFEMFLPSATPTGTFSASPNQRNRRCGTHDGNAGIHSTSRGVLPTATPGGATSAISSATKVHDARNRRALARHPTPPPRA